MTTRIRRSILVPTFFALLVSARPALAGPPLLCHPFDIEGAASLPWGSGTWFAERRDYELARLVGDTQELLAPATPVIVRMETLRRAAIYASRDQKVAASLLAALTNKVHAGNSRTGSDPLAYLDAAYIIEALRQVGMMESSSEFRDRAPAMRQLVKDLDGYALIQKSLLVRPGDPALEFAAALIASQNHRAAYLEHAQKARAGASKDALLIKNVKLLT